jgi:dTDP-3-amino-2,3,6-trideoxy-4-keto-D-glucose/dTDP-3-amino-3,4,6-trideoxy-alpha-D-glucose/dTDP-2,6-dideoxy-D-kanosamine transaminase
MTETLIKMFDYRTELSEGGLRSNVLEAVERVLDSGWLILGPEVEAFEKAMAEALGGGQAVGVANGTDALVVALWARGIGPGDEVITVANTAVPTASAIAISGATPVFCDIDPRTGLIDIDQVVSLVGPKTRAVIPVHLYGNAVDVPRLLELVAPRGLFVLEDCAQAQGTTLRGQAVGALGHAATFSFYPTKNLGAYGDGGLCFTRDAALADAMRRVRKYGFTERDYAGGRGMNSRLDELHAAILRVKLPRLAGYVKARQRLAAIYDAELPTHVERLDVTPGSSHARHLYTVRVDDRDGLAVRLGQAGIESGVHYRHALHKMPAFSGARLPSSGLLHTERHVARILSLPLHPSLSEQQVLRVCRAIESQASRH